MRRLLALLTALALAGILAACGEPASQRGSGSASSLSEERPSQHGDTSSSAFPSVSSAPDGSTPSPVTGGHSVLVAYFSATGNTAELAATLQSVLDADLYEIVPEEPYTNADLDYRTDNCRASQEQADPSARPAIRRPLEHPEKYDVVFLGYPIWWGQAPKLIYTFLEQCDFGDATLVPFCTSGSSGIDGSLGELQALAPDARWLEGQRFRAGTGRDTVVQWVRGLDLSQV